MILNVQTNAEITSVINAILNKTLGVVAVEGDKDAVIFVNEPKDNPQLTGKISVKSPESLLVIDFIAGVATGFAFTFIGDDNE